jgi:Nitrous oxide reductase
MRCSLALSVCTMLASAVLTGCATRSGAGNSPAIAAAKTIDNVAAQVEQYGVVSVSPPILVAADGRGGQSPFTFDLQQSAAQYYTDARHDVQAKLAVTRQSLASLEVQGRYGEPRHRIQQRRDVRVSDRTSLHSRRRP